MNCKMIDSAYILNHPVLYKHTSLLEKLKKTFDPFREKRSYYENHPKKVETILAQGAAKVRAVSHQTMQKVREVTGLKY